MVLAMRSLSCAMVVSSLGMLEQLLAGEAAGGVGGVIGRGADLAREIEHVG